MTKPPPTNPTMPRPPDQEPDRPERVPEFPPKIPTEIPEIEDPKPGKREEPERQLP